jgi:hypothetical protein
LHHYDGMPFRLPRYKRVSTIAPMQLTDRDRGIIRLVHRHRFLRSRQVIALLGGSKQQIVRRLQLLFHHSYLERPRAQIQYYERGGSKSIAYGLGNEGGALLRQEFGVTVDSDSWSEKNHAIGRVFLEHTLLVSDVMVSLELACRKHDIRLLYEDELNLQVEANPFHWQVTIVGGTKLGVIPDRAFALEYADHTGQVQRAYYFLEADRGTMPVVRKGLAQTSFYRKLLAYEATWTNKVHQRQLGIPRFRVLTVTISPARAKSLLDACSRLQRGHGLFLFADKSALQKDLLAAVWQCGKGTAMSTLVDLPDSATPHVS